MRGTGACSGRCRSSARTVEELPTMVGVDNTSPPEASVGPEPTSRNWAWPVVASGVVLALLVAGAIGWWLGSGDDGTVESVDVVEQWRDAWLSGDPEAVVDLYSDDGVFVNYWVIEDAIDFEVDSTAAPTFMFQGRDNLRFAVSSWMSRNTLENMGLESVVTGDYVIVAETVWSGVENSASAATFSEPLVVTFELDDQGLITRSIAIYRDDME